MSDYTCGGCGKFGFGSASGLRLHKSMNDQCKHAGDNWTGRRQCSRCKRGADTRKLARAHVKICRQRSIAHTTSRIKPPRFSQELTDLLGNNAFIQTRVVDRVMLPDFKARCCDRTFRSPYALSRHKQIAHWSYQCNCGKTFVRECNYDTHYKICQYIPELENNVIVLAAELVGVDMDDVIIISSDESSDDSN